MTSESHFSVPRMDCPADAQRLRRTLEPLPTVVALRTDLDTRTLVVWHHGPPEALLSHLHALGLDAGLAHTRQATPPSTDIAAEGRVLRQLLAINGVLFVVELILGFVAQSTGLIADSLDMLADAMVYGLSLYAVGRGLGPQKRAARISGWLQLVLALGALGEVARRTVVGSEPVEGLMIGVAALALVANGTCVALLARHRHGGVHLRASWIFSTNDALANLGVIAAGGLVWATGSAVPDLVVGAAVGTLVLAGAVRILRLSK